MRTYTRADPVDRLILKTRKVTSGCIEWNAAADKGGYGWIRRPGRHGRFVYAHRLAYELFVGPIPQGLQCLHRCDNPRCVNPTHLFLGTHQDNVDDKMSKGRHRSPRGEDHAGSKLTADDIVQIRKRRSNGETLQAIADDYEIAFQTVSGITLRKVWRHIP